MSTTCVAAEPYRWPYNGALRPDNTALIVIDMQTDFCGPGGYVDVMGYDLALVQAPIAPVIVWVVLTGIPQMAVPRSMIAPALSAQKPPTGRSFAIF
jgi:nicotinamidase-related amidase